MAGMLFSFCWHVVLSRCLFPDLPFAPEIKQKSPSSSMGEDSFGLVTNDADDSVEAKNAAAEAVNPGVILKSTSVSEVISRSNESLDDYGGGGGLKSSNRTSFKAARQHAKVD